MRGGRLRWFWIEGGQTGVTTMRLPVCVLISPAPSRRSPAHSRLRGRQLAAATWKNNAQASVITGTGGRISWPLASAEITRAARRARVSVAGSRASRSTKSAGS